MPFYQTQFNDTGNSYFTWHRFSWRSKMSASVKKWQQSYHHNLSETDTIKKTLCSKARENLAWIATLNQERCVSLTCVRAEIPTFFLIWLSYQTTKNKGDQLLLQLSFHGLKCHAHRNWPPPSHFLPPVWLGDSKNTNMANTSGGALLSRSYRRLLQVCRKKLFGFKFHTHLKCNTQDADDLDAWTFLK